MSAPDFCVDANCAGLGSGTGADTSSAGLGPGTGATGAVYTTGCGSGDSVGKESIGEGGNGSVSSTVGESGAPIRDEPPGTPSIDVTSLVGPGASDGGGVRRPPKEKGGSASLGSVGRGNWGSGGREI